jgi:hypothetical protein
MKDALCHKAVLDQTSFLKQTPQETEVITQFSNGNQQLQDNFSKNYAAAI